MDGVQFCFCRPDCEHGETAAALRRGGGRTAECDHRRPPNPRTLTTSDCARPADHNHALTGQPHQQQSPQHPQPSLWFKIPYTCTLSPKHPEPNTLSRTCNPQPHTPTHQAQCFDSRLLQQPIRQQRLCQRALASKLRDQPYVMVLLAAPLPGGHCIAGYTWARSAPSTTRTTAALQGTWETNRGGKGQWRVAGSGWRSRHRYIYRERNRDGSIERAPEQELLDGAAAADRVTQQAAGSDADWSTRTKARQMRDIYIGACHPWWTHHLAVAMQTPA